MWKKDWKIDLQLLNGEKITCKIKNIAEIIIPACRCIGIVQHLCIFSHEADIGIQ